MSRWRCRSWLIACAQRAPGMLGGEPGATGRRKLLDGAPIDPRETLVAAPGSRLTLETPGGGGFGSATERTG